MQGVPQIWIYTYQDVQKNFVNVVSYIKAVLWNDLPDILKEYSSLDVFEIFMKNISNMQVLTNLAYHYQFINYVEVIYSSLCSGIYLGKS